ncbi:MAG: helix-turn-helix domain-containing protein [Lachnospiraceae bacterium]|nr:helix-turn-helix domain-containing protein [Lachnospiraceae bacterium]
MKTIAERIREGMELRNLKQADLVEKTGISKGALSSYISGRYEPKQNNIYLIAKALSVNEAWLMGVDVPMEKIETNNNKRGITINVLGRVAAGIPIEAVENIIDTEEITEELARTGKFFGLRIQGDSMEPDIHNGDTVIVRQQDDAESDEIVIALVNGNDGVCKRLKKYENSIALVSINANYEPLYFTNKEITDKPVRIIGKVIELRRKL